MNIGDYVLISPDVTHKLDWIEGRIIEVEDNPFVGTVISAETADHDVFFAKDCYFRKAS